MQLHIYLHLCSYMWYMSDYIAQEAGSLEMPIPQQSSPLGDDGIIQCPRLVEQSSEVTDLEELLTEHPSANVAFMGGRSVSVPPGGESISMEDDSSIPVHESQDETPFQQESQAGAELSATMTMAKNNMFPVKAEGSIVTGTCLFYALSLHKQWIILSYIRSYMVRSTCVVLNW